MMKYSTMVHIFSCTWFGALFSVAFNGEWVMFVVILITYVFGLGAGIAYRLGVESGEIKEE